LEQGIRNLETANSKSGNSETYVLKQGRGQYAWSQILNVAGLSRVTDMVGLPKG